MSASYPTKIYLAMKSGNICALKECHIPLTSEGNKADPVVVGEAAHVYGENPGTKMKPPSARYKDDMTDEERNHYNNLIYLCPTCHTKIDKQEEDYPAELLFMYKNEHEAWVVEQLNETMPNVTFAELEVAAKAIASGQYTMNGDFNVITPEEKIKKNGLSKEINALIVTGLSRSYEVSEYLVKVAYLDEKFPERLKNGFKVKYLELKKSMSSDALFMAMFEFSQAGKHDFKQQAASLAILSHLFHLCEVFEK